jgi:LacI family transcriptional regulator
VVRWKRFHRQPEEVVPTIAQVAKQAGVGVATVSRVLNCSPAVREETRRRVLDAIAELGYAPNAAARALSTGRTRAIGVVAPFFTRPSVIQRLRGISRVLAGGGYQLVLFGVEQPGEREEYFRALPDGGGLDGVLSISLCPTDGELERFTAAGVPVVLIDHPHALVPAVHTDDRAGGRLATEHLLELGHARIAFLGDREGAEFGFTSSAMRRAGYEAALANAGIGVDPELVRLGPYEREVAAAMTRELLEGGDRPTALFAASDTQALAALEAVRALGASVPGDLSIVGYDDIELARYLGLTTVAQPLEESGVRGTELLLAVLEGAPAPSRQLEVELMVRSTTAKRGTKNHRRHRAGGRERPRRVRREGMKVRS